MTHATKLKDAMTEYPTISSVRTTVSEASELMKKLGIRHLPVVDEGVVVGVISDRDLRQAEMLSDAMTLFVTDVMSAKPYCAKVGTPLAEVAREMADRTCPARRDLHDHGWNATIERTPSVGR